MDSEQRRKRKRVAKTYSYSQAKLFRLRSIIITLSLLGLILFLYSDRFPLNTASFRPSLSTHFLYSSTSNALIDSLTTKRQTTSSSELSFPGRVGDRVLFPDHVLVFTEHKILKPEGLDCVYFYDNDITSNGLNGSLPEVGFAVRPAVSSDGYDEFRSIVRCPLPPANFTGVDLRWRGTTEYWPASKAFEPHRRDRTAVKPWDRLVYEAAIDGDTNTVVVFVKGLNLRPHRKSDPLRFRCRFGLKKWESDGKEGLILATPAISAAQEIVRCALPKSIQTNPDKARGIRVTISYPSGNARTGQGRVSLPSVARIYGSEAADKQRKRELNERAVKRDKHELCVCTMVWNQASALKEWIMYHAWLGVERWFIYDNNSDDGIKEVVQELDGQGYNVSRLTWPWIKTQEAGFSHCALRARDECNWVGFFDVDEFFYFPYTFRYHRGESLPGQNSLRELVANLSSSKTIGEIRTTCHSFGPSGLITPPAKGLTVGYTCRLQRPERHKSIVRPDLLDFTLLNVVHHFRLKEGYRYLNVPENTALVNHYKYQVWESFRSKFYRRVATYVVDWKEDQNKGSKDRAPGLGTEAIEPTNWRLQFCEVWDTGLRDFVLAYLADSVTGSLPWEDRSKAQL